MLFINLINILLSNAVTAAKEKSILYSRSLVIGLLCLFLATVNSSYLKPLHVALGIYNGFFNINIITQYFNSFILILSCVIGILTAFYGRDSYDIKYFKLDGSEKDIIDNSISDKNISDNDITENKETNIRNQNDSQFNIIEYSLIILFVLFGAILLMSTGDLVSLFLSIELQSYGLYILSTIYRDSESATNSGLTYFLLGGLSSCFILLGSAIIYVNTGNTNLDNIFIINSIDQLTLLSPEILKESLTLNEASYTLYENLNTFKINYIDFSLIVLTVGLLFKVSAAPFHFWSPDVYDGIPTIVTTFVAIIAKISILILMLELISYTDISLYDIAPLTNENTQSSEYKIYNISYEWKNIIALSSLMSLIIGSVLGLTQYRIKRLFAYSTISHVGFILLALCINSIESIQGYIFYILQYSISNLNAFFILITIGYTLHEYIIKPSAISSTSAIESENNKSKNLKSSKSNKDNKYIDIENSPIQLLSQIKGYFYVNSYISISFAITLFSFVGIPPLIGFFAKQMVLSAALDQGYIFITLVAIITSVIGAAYYLNVVKLIFFTTSDYVKKNVAVSSEKNELLRANNTNIICVNNKLSAVISILTILILLFIFMPDEWFRIVNILSFSVSKY